ncbi:hypothetical protein [Telluribacter sp. SYSU D00476]|uniref:hypothetical protein n=1 Tax=Telluribacter sp. SYSU D00476 TaxID=2811430 RepID=UPI001FF54AD0|nr:hypothetical protein [Telluribacter sp. SYSU D00476]
MYSKQLQVILSDGWLANPWAIMVEGIVGTALMTLFMYVLTYLTHRTMKVVKILGTMLTFSTSPTGQLSGKPLALVAGTAAHYTVGILFSYCFHLLWNMGIGQPDYLHSFLLGLAFGLFGSTVWYLFFKVHPNPPKVHLRPYLFSLLPAHLIFASGVIMTHHWIHIVVIPVQPLDLVP